MWDNDQIHAEHALGNFFRAVGACAAMMLPTETERKDWTIVGGIRRVYYRDADSGADGKADFDIETGFPIYAAIVFRMFGRWVTANTISTGHKAVYPFFSALGGYYGSL